MTQQTLLVNNRLSILINRRILRENMAQNQKRLQRRLKYERNFLEKYFYGEEFPWRKKGEEYILERQIKTEKWKYRLRIYVGCNYPFELPKLVICDSPRPMPDSFEWQGSHVTHTYPRYDEFLQICFFRPLSWTRENRLYEVFNKGEEWLEAYEEHLETGKAMNEILSEMEPSQDEIKIQRRRDNDLARFFEHLMMNIALPMALECGLIAFELPTVVNNFAQLEFPVHEENNITEVSTELSGDSETLDKVN